ncbi:MAG: hypothetical protein AAFY34_04465 [Pseudomonadota bacterium]
MASDPSVTSVAAITRNTMTYRCLKLDAAYALLLAKWTAKLAVTRQIAEHDMMGD